MYYTINYDFEYEYDLLIIILRSITLIVIVPSNLTSWPDAYAISNTRPGVTEWELPCTNRSGYSCLFFFFARQLQHSLTPYDARGFVLQSGYRGTFPLARLCLELYRCQMGIAFGWASWFTFKTYFHTRVESIYQVYFTKNRIYIYFFN